MEWDLDLSVTLGGALLAGLLSFASPCVLPLVPPYLAFLAGSSLSDLSGSEDGATVDPTAQRRAVISAIAFTLGFATVFTVMGASASAIGQTFADNLDWLSYVAGAIIIVMGLHFLGVLRINLLYRQAKFEIGRRPAGLIGAYVIGLAFAFGWTPCVGPVLAAILFTAGGAGDPAQGALLLFTYALGIGVPFIAAAMFVGPFLNLMKRYRSYIGHVEKAMGGLLVAVGLLFITNQMSTIAFWLLDLAPSLGQFG
ncbi:MAG: cytochrome c biogenesis protein CcdA [Pseudomonadota bacterium]